MSLKIFLLRHGETEHSQQGSYCGNLDPNLTEAGQQMAHAFAEQYAQMQWQGIYVSPMLRAINTAQPLCNAINRQMEVRSGLKEIAYGAWEGKQQEEVSHVYAQDYIRWLTEPAWNPPTDGETAVQIANRALPVITEIQASYNDGNVLVVSHKATIRIIICGLLGIDLGRYRDRLDVPAGSISVIKFDLHGPMLQILGDRNYMPDCLRHRVGT